MDQQHAATGAGVGERGPVQASEHGERVSLAERSLAGAVLLDPPLLTATSTARRRGADRSGPARQIDLIEHLGDRDSLFSLLSRVMPWSQAATAAATLISRYGTLTEVLAAPEEELAAIDSLGAGMAGVLKVVHATALRFVAAPLKQGPLLKRWQDVVNYLIAAMAREPVEQARVLFLDTRNRLIADEVVARGGPRGVNPDHCGLARRAVQLHATAIILAHNHPSGDPLPSPEDIVATHEIERVLAAVNVILHDHVVVARGGVVSLRDLGVIAPQPIRQRAGGKERPVPEAARPARRRPPGGAPSGAYDLP